MGNRHLVTGGSGFLGNLIAKKLLENGEDVKILDIWEDKDRPSEIEFVKCDVRDSQGVFSAMQGIDIVHHNAAKVPLHKTVNETKEVNINGCKIVAEQAIKAGVKAFIHMSSSAIFGVPHKVPINSKTPLNPVEHYGRAKLEGELIVRDLLDKAKTPLIVIRPRTILGEGRLGIFQILFEWIKENRNIYTIGDGNGLFQFVQANDLIDAYILALDNETPGVYNVGASEFGTLKVAIENIIKYAGSDSKVKSLPVGLTINTLKLLDFLKISPLAPWHYLTYHKPFYFDVEPLLNMGWKPRYSNDDMLKESYNWFLSNHEKSNNNKINSVHRSPVKQGILNIVKKLS